MLIKFLKKGGSKTKNNKQDEKQSQRKWKGEKAKMEDVEKVVSIGFFFMLPS